MSSTLLIFIPTFLLVAISPGPCMMLALNLGLKLGLRRTIAMMLGELCGVALVSMAAALGVATLLLADPQLYWLLKICGGGYLIYLGLQGLRSHGTMFNEPTSDTAFGPRALWLKGFIVAIANPKGWAFMLALLPPFIDHSQPLFLQLTLLLISILLCEWLSMMLYASGGSRLRQYLRPQNIRRIEQLSGALMVTLGLWLWING
ncbi:MAG: LysE family translocator [Ferrimonas sp.]